jgi:hypothetical protein
MADPTTPESLDDKRARQTAAREAMAQKQRETPAPVADFDSRRQARETATAAERARQQRARIAESRAVHAPLSPDQAAATRAHRQNTEARADAHRNALRIANCRLCDTDGYFGTVICDHVDRSGVLERGRAKVRAALASTKRPRIQDGMDPNA